MKHWANFREIQTANNLTDQGFFGPDAMKLRDTRLCGEVIRGRYFITSEVPDGGTGRRYSVRRADDVGRIETVGELCEHPTREAAYDAAAVAAMTERQTLESALRAAKSAERSVRSR